MKEINLANRLDIVIKYLYIRNYLSSSPDNNIEDLYTKHIQILTAFREWDKKTLEDFTSSFKELIQSIQSKWYMWDKVSIGKNNSPITGAHRIASCLYFDIHCPTQKNNSEKGIIVDIDWLLKNNFSQDNIRLIIKTYGELSWDNFIILWPTCKAEKLSNESLRYIYNFPTKYHTKETILDIYGYDNYWSYDVGIENKADICSEYTYFIVVFLSWKFEKEPLRSALLGKVDSQKINAESKKYYTFHSPDTDDETQYLKDILFSSSYFSHLIKRTQAASSELTSKLSSLKKVYSRDMCIVWSGPLWIYRLSAISDIDLISKWIIPDSERIIKLDSKIDLLNYQYYEKVANEDIITKHFFYWRGFKFISLEYLVEVKSQGLRKKDSEQAKVLKEFLSQDKMHTIWLRQKIWDMFKYYKTRLLISIISFWIAFTKALWIYEPVSKFWREKILIKLRK